MTSRPPATLAGTRALSVEEELRSCFRQRPWGDDADPAVTWTGAVLIGDVCCLIGTAGHNSLFPRLLGFG